MKLKFQKGQGIIEVIGILIIIGLASGIIYYSFFRPAEKKSEVAKISEFPQAVNEPIKEPIKEEPKPEAIQPVKITPPPQESPPPEKTQTPIIQNKVLESNIVVIEDDGTLVGSGYVESDIGLIDISGKVDEKKTIKKFFQNHPDAMNIYDFIILATTFKPGNNIGHFTSSKNEIKGTGDSNEDIDLVNTHMDTGLSGEEKFQGCAFVANLDSIGNDLHLLIHELSHRWLFKLGDYDSCGKGFGCTRETGFKINSNGAHYNAKINILTKEGGKTYRDPNGGGSMVLAPTSDYCLDFGGGDAGYRFTSMSLYLMGLIPVDQVVPLKWYTTTGSWSEKGIPCVEKTFSVQDVINLVGPRNPSYPNTQKDFSVVYILLTEKGKKPTDVQMKRMDYIAENFPIRWNEATNYKSTINGKGIIR